MPPPLASLLTVAFVLFLFWRDKNENSGVSSAVWLPTLWLLIISTRPVTVWLGMFGLSVGGSSLEEGSLIDALVSFGAIAIGIKILCRRNVDLGTVIRNNCCIVIYVVYCLLAVTWSDFPFVALKRWIKDLGHPIMVLILLTELNTHAAVTCFLKKTAYVVAPFSILFIKYYPEWGRGFDEWTGAAYNMGIAAGKNQLGNTCLILTFFFVWHLLVTLGLPATRSRRNELIITIGFLSMLGWLFFTANSKTPLVALVAGLALLFATGVRRLNRERIGTYLAVGLAMVCIAELTFGIYEGTLHLLGRNASLTDRVPLWAELRKWGEQSPMFGAGFESFWLGERRIKLGAEWNVNNAHSGYLQTYLDLGLFGLLLLSLMIISVFSRVRAALVRFDSFGRFRFGFFFSILIYNITEASLHGVHPIYFMLFLIGMSYPRFSHEEDETSHSLVDVARLPTAQRSDSAYLERTNTEESIDTSLLPPNRLQMRFDGAP